MNFKLYLYSLITAGVLVTSCNKDVLDRPPLNTPTDETFWKNETDLRLYSNAFYPNYFTGYNTGFVLDYAPVRGYTFSDDLTNRLAQTAFESTVPTSRGSTSETATWLTQHGGPTWDFAWVRKANILIDRLETKSKPLITTEAFNHWTAVGRFFRGFEYSRLVSVFGNVPYFDKPVADNDFATLFKDRDSRGVVMDNVYEDFKFVLSNIRVNDGKQNLNRYIAAAFISRLMLYEGTYQHYHNLDAARAKKYLELAVEAAQYVMSNASYTFSSDFKALFTSDNLSGNAEVIMYRTYDAALGVTHSVGSYNNGTEVNTQDANLNLLKSFIANDGKVYQNSGVVNVSSWVMSDLAKTRDPRFDATFVDKPYTIATTLIYGYKYAPRDVVANSVKPIAWSGSTNTSDAPVIRLGEVVLNWIEAKAVLAAYMGGAAVTQADINKSINAIRSRPLDAAAITKGVKKTAAMDILNLPVDPARDTDVPPLIWEIRRERRMEFAYEFSRLSDLKRWKKLSYMDFTSNITNDHYLGAWVNIPVDAPGLLVNGTRVVDLTGTVKTYNGTNASDMVGFYLVTGAANRTAFTDRSYLSPIGTAQINEYKDKGFTLTQTTGW